LPTLWNFWFLFDLFIIMQLFLNVVYLKFMSLIELFLSLFNAKFNKNIILPIEKNEIIFYMVFM